VRPVGIESIMAINRTSSMRGGNWTDDTNSNVSHPCYRDRDCITSVYAAMDAVPVTRPMQLRVELLSAEEAVAWLDVSGTMACDRI